MARQIINLDDTKTIIQNFDPTTGTAVEQFRVNSGSRIVFTLYVKSIDPATLVTAKIKNSFSEDIPFTEIKSISASVIGPVNDVITDFHNLFDVEVTVTGGNASYGLAVTIKDNALATRIDIENAEIKVDIDAAPGPNGQYSSTRVSDGIDELQINPDGSINIGAQALPTGAATEAKQDIGNSSLADIDSNTQTIISALASIYTDMSTGAKQDIGNASLASIASIVATAANQSTANATLASILSIVATAAKQDTGNTSLASILSIVATAAKQDTGNASLASIDSKVSTEAKQDAGNMTLASILSIVATAANQSTANTTLASILSAMATAAKQDTGNTSLASIDSKVSTAANQAILNTRIGDITETAPATDIASSGLNGRLQRIAQRLTSIFTGQSDGSQKTKLVSAGGNTADVTASGSVFTNLRNSAGTEVGTLANPLQTNVGSGSLTPSDGIATTYSACAFNLNAANLATDIFTLTGSASKTIKVTRFGISGTQTTLGDITFLLNKRSSANSGGTSSVLAAVPHDSSDAAASATVRSYTANPTLGTLVGAIRAAKLFVPTSSSNSTEMFLEFDLSTGFSKPIYLRGINEVLAINLNGVTVAGNSFNIYIEWTEV